MAGLLLREAVPLARLRAPTGGACTNGARGPCDNHNFPRVPVNDVGPILDPEAKLTNSFAQP